MNSDPVKVDVSLSQGVTIQWRDGHVSRYAIRALRESCPCAGCTGAHGEVTTAPAPLPASNPLQIFKPNGSTLLRVAPVGNYALQFFFSDEHNAGIFTWEYLRELCPCEECRKAVDTQQHRTKT